MKKLLAVVAVAAALSFGLPGGANATVFECNDQVLLLRLDPPNETIGDVNVACSGYTLTVTFDTRAESEGDGSWTIVETNVHVKEYVGLASLCATLPQNGQSNPQPGKFNTDANVFSKREGAQLSAHVFGLTGNGSVIIAAHADVRNQDPPPPTDDAWGDGTPFDGRSGATCFMVDINGIAD